MELNEICDLVAEAQREQLKNPARAVVNSEAAFVAGRIHDAGHPDIAARYWSWVCGYHYKRDLDFNETVRQLQDKLEQIDKGVSAPEWATYGT